MTNPKAYVIGAGLAGLSASVALAAKGIEVELFEQAGQAGGRCRSYFDAGLGTTIDNGNHLVLSGNRATMAYLRTIGGERSLVGPDSASTSFTDLATGERWTIRPNDGAVPFWMFNSAKRVPGTKPFDYLQLAALLTAAKDKTIADTIACKGPLWDRLLRPFLLAALNTEPEISSAALAAQLIRETFARGGHAYHARIAHPTLASAFVDPALRFLDAARAQVHLGERLKRIEENGERVTALEIADKRIDIDSDALVVVAVPPWIIREILPDVPAPNEFSAIVNAHFRIAPPAGTPGMLGLLGGTAEWVFAFPDRISVTVSGADRLVDTPREELANTLWRDVARAHGLADTLPPWQIVKEKRATFAATPAQNRLRAKAKTAWSNLFLAGDWTDTGLPSTIEGAIRSGNKAAELALARSSV